MRGRISLLPLVALLLVPSPGSTQSTPAPAPASQDIVVRGTQDLPSDWREAETDHVVVVSDGSQADLVRIANNLERLNFLLSILLDRVDKPDDTLKLRVTLIGNGAEFDAMDLRNLRAQAGPYVPTFMSQRYYDPREDGAVMAVSRVDRKAILERGVPLAFVLPDLVRATQGPAVDPGNPSGTMPPMPGGAMPGMSGHFGGPMRFAADDDPYAINVNEKSVKIDAESRIYAGFAQHYLLTHFPQAYPRWYVDGFGELFATIVAPGAGELDYGRPPSGYRRVLEEYLRYPIGEVLTGRYLTDRDAEKRWTPFHAWALTHMLFFSDARRPQLRTYLAAIARGEPMEKAAAAFGDLAVLQRELRAYDNHKVPYERMTYPAERIGEPLVRQLTRGQAAFLKGRLELGGRIDLPSAIDERARRTAIAERDEWLAELRKDAARYRNSREAQLLLAEAECRSGNAAPCIAAAEEALRIEPGDSDALAWKGSGQLLQALAQPAGSRAAALKTARVTIARANRADTDNPLPLIAYYRSFAEAGETPPDLAIEGLMKAVDTVPAAPGPRVMLGEALAKRGLTDAARDALRPVAQGAYDTPERAQAVALLATL